MFDSHCHLTDVAEPERVVAEALSHGLRGMMACGYDNEANRALVLLSQKLPSLSFALGIHPWFADQDVSLVEDMSKEKLPVAIGEVGLDLDPRGKHPPFARQLVVLERQLQLAQDLGLPVSLHCRKAWGSLRDVLGQFPGVRGVLHGFGGSFEQAIPFFERGWFVGVGGLAVRPRNRKARRVAKEVPLDRLLIETDCPFNAIGPVSRDDARPWHVAEVARAVAEIRSVPIEQVEWQTDANVSELLAVRWNEGGMMSSKG